MAKRKLSFLEHEVYFVFNKGNFSHDIFHDEQDYQRFLKIVFLSNGNKKFKYKDFLKYNKNIFEINVGDKIVNLISFVCLPNTFFFLLELKPQRFGKSLGVNRHLDNNLSIFMKRVGSAYSMYYNKKYSKTGSLFEGKFKAEHVSDQSYFKYLFSLINLSPINLIQKDWKEVGVKDFEVTKKFLEEYKYSSFKYFFPKFGSLNNEKLIETENFYKKVGFNQDLSKEIFDWIKYKIIS